MGKRLLIFTCCIILIPFHAQAREDIDNITEKLSEKLSVVTSTKDSIEILYNLFDLSPRPMQRVYGRQLLQTAISSQNYQVEMDMLMHLSILYANNDSILSYMLQCAKQIPESDEKKECEVFLQLQIINLQAKFSAQQQQVSDFIKTFESEYAIDDDDLFSKILRTNTICIYLAFTSSGVLYTEYLNKLEALINQLPPHLYVLRNQFYTRAAIVHTTNEDYTKAIKADKELLNIIKKLERRYLDMGRIYRNYDVNYYICYRRILSNYPGLTRKELDEYYHKCLEICKRSIDVKNDRETMPRIDAFYMFATQHYNKAIPYIQKCLLGDLSATNRRKMLRMLRDAAEIIGDDALLLKTLNDYNILLEDFQNQKADEFVKELQIRYDVEMLKAENTQLALQQQKEKSRNNRIIIWIIFPTLIIALILLVIAINAYFRSHKLTTRLKHSSEALIRERDMLNQTQTELVVAYKRAEEANRAKSEFMHSMSHEVRTPLNSILGFSQLIVKKIPEELREQLGKYANLVKINTDYLATLINDILDISSIESDEMAFPQTHNVSIHALCQHALNEIQDRVKSGVTLRFDSSNPDLEITTDREHVEQVLVNLLSNAAKFTKQGSITIGYHFKGLNKLVFEVTDTGIGIPAGKEEVIFDRFTKLDSFSQGSGLGLYLSRQLALRLGGDLYVDQSYHNGAKFCFTIPIPKKN